MQWRPPDLSAGAHARTAAFDNQLASPMATFRASRSKRLQVEDALGPVSTYLGAVATLVKVVFRLAPTVPTTRMIATEIPAAMRPYSIAVAPDSSRKKRASFDILELPQGYVVCSRSGGALLRQRAFYKGASKKNVLEKIQFVRNVASLFLGCSMVTALLRVRACARGAAYLSVV